MTQSRSATHHAWVGPFRLAGQHLLDDLDDLGYKREGDGHRVASKHALADKQETRNRLVSFCEHQNSPL